MSLSRMPSGAPPPYTGAAPRNDIPDSAMEQHQNNSHGPPPPAPRSRPMPPMPRLRVVNLNSPSSVTPPTFPEPDVDPFAARQSTHNERRFGVVGLPTVSELPVPLQPQRSTPSPTPTSSSDTPLSTTAYAPSYSLSSPTHTYSPPQPFPLPHSKNQGSKRRLKFNLSALRLSGATRRATAQIAEHAARQAAEHARYDAEIARQREAAADAARRAAEHAARIEEDKAMRLAMVQNEAKLHVQSYMQSFLAGDPPSEGEINTGFLACVEVCKSVGLNFAAVLQEPLIEGQPPVYWAILNRPTAFGTSRAAYDVLVFALLESSQPLSPLTLAAVRLACMTASDNTLLQRLFRRVPGLSPLSPSDAMLLAPLNDSDVVEVMETRDGTGTYIAQIRILRFRLRMRVSKCVVVEFVASGTCARALQGRASPDSLFTQRESGRSGFRWSSRPRRTVEWRTSGFCRSNWESTRR